MSGSEVELPAGGDVPACQTPPPADPIGSKSQVKDAGAQLIEAEASPEIQPADVAVLSRWYCSLAGTTRQGGQDLSRSEADYQGLFKRFANESASQLIELAPPSDGRVPPPDQLRSAHTWYQRLQEIDRNDRAARFRYYEETLVSWLQDLVRSAGLELRNALAVALLADEGHWREFLEEDGRCSFQSANHFIKTYLHMWGLGDSNTRVSRLRSSAQLWLRLEGYDVPVPGTLSRLEYLSARDDGIEIYLSLVRETDNQVPSDAAIKKRVAEVDGKPPEKKLDQASRETLKALVAELDGLVLKATEPNIEAIKATTRKLVDGYGPAEPRPKRMERVPLPAWDASWRPPFELRQAEKTFTVSVTPLPKEFEDVVVQQALRYRWMVGEAGAAGRDLTIERTGANEAELHAIRHFVNHWACRVSRLLGAPEPVELKPPPAAVGAA